MAEANLTIQRTETRRGYTIIWVDDEFAVVYDMKGNAFQVGTDYCSCGKEPCVHQRAVFDLDQPTVHPYQTSQEARRAPVVPEVVYQVDPSQRGPAIHLSLGQALVIYPLATVVEWAGNRVLKLAGVK